MIKSYKNAILVKILENNITYKDKKKKLNLVYFNFIINVFTNFVF